MENKLHYVRLKREKYGSCNICKQIGQLSWDHVPPKGSIIYSDVEIWSVSNQFINIDKPPRVYSQNGIKYRTICPECNNMIGSKYDIVFNNFIKRLIELVHENIGRKDSFEIKVNINALIKALFAHLLASKGELEDTVPDQKMRDIVLGNSETPLNVYYWFYPFAANQVIRDIVVSEISSGVCAMVSILKLFPIAFLVTDSNEYIRQIHKLNAVYDSSNTAVNINFELNHIFDYRWPLIVDNDHLIMGGQSINSAVLSLPRE